ncbi:MAG: DUF711 family protein, partial [Clostridia bacterium]|nr:DUF711 family protein [Clostridia bacterium]
MFTNFDVLETIQMVEKEHLDIRTITMGLSLLSCIRDNAKDTAQRVYDLVCSKAEKIVKTASELSDKYGIPIVNKRVSVTPVSLLCAAFPADAPLIAKALDDAAERLGIDFLGGYSALVHKSTASYERTFIETIPEVLASTKRLCSSVNVGSTKSGITMEAVGMLGKTFKQAAALTADADGIGAAKLVAFCNAVEDN